MILPLIADIIKLKVDLLHTLDVNIMMTNVEKIKKDNRGRPRLLSDELKRAISRTKENNPDWSARRILEDIQKQLAKKLGKQHPDWDGEQIQNRVRLLKLPSVNSVQRYIREISPPKKQQQRHSYLDSKKWHWGLMAERNPAPKGGFKYPECQLPPEVIPDILAVQEWANEEHPEAIMFSKSEGVTIRQALWIARLSGITNILRNSKLPSRFDINHWLWAWSKAYAQYEKLCELSKTPFDTSKLDNAIWSNNYAWPVTGENAIDLIDDNAGTIETIIEIIETEKDGEA